MTWEDHAAKKLMAGVIYQNKGRVRCGVCKYYLCTCQLTLNPDWVEVKKVVHHLTYREKISNCPHNCVNADKCLNCYDFEMFKMEVKL